MELDVTRMVEDADTMPMLSGSVMELGDNASKITWRNAISYGKDHPLLTTDEQRDAARAHFAEYGAWTEGEIAAWPEDELQGIMCQEVAHAIREMEVARDEDGGVVGGNLSLGDNGRWYFYLGS